jgi:hypothetical protein
MIDGGKEKCQYSAASLAELLIFLTMAVLLTLMFLSTAKSVDSLEFVFAQKQ